MQRFHLLLGLGQVSFRHPQLAGEAFRLFGQPRDLGIEGIPVPHQPDEFLFVPGVVGFEFRVQVREFLQVRIGGIQLGIKPGQAFGQFFEPAFFLKDRLLAALQIVSELLEFALAGHERGFGAERTRRQSAVRFQEFPLQRDESATPSRPLGQRQGNIQRFDNPRIGQ